MCNPLYTYKEYAVLDTGSQLVVKNSKGKYENHSHFRRKTDKKGNINIDIAKTCIKLADQHKIPLSPYMLTACMRLTTDTEYRNTLDRIRQQRRDRSHYINVNKGNKK